MMLKIHEALDGITIQVLRGALEAQGIACEVRGQYRTTAMGETPPIECWTELWLLDDAQADLAREIIARAGSLSSSSWICGNCGESVEGQFEQCWNCQCSRPA